MYTQISPQPSGWACTSGPAGREIAALRRGAAAGCRRLRRRACYTISLQQPAAAGCRQFFTPNQSRSDWRAAAWGRRRPATPYSRVRPPQAELTSGQYLIVYEAGNLAADASKDAKSTGIGANGTNVKVTIENNEIKTSADAFTLTVLDASNGTATIQNTTGSYLNSSSGSNGIVSATAEEKRNCTITVNEDSTVKIANFDATTQFRVNTSNGIFFRFYKNETVTGTTASNYKALCLYKKVE